MNFKTTVLGIELGSTRIKAVVLDKDHKPVAQGGFEWENRLCNGIWTYSMDDVLRGIRECYKDLTDRLGERPAEFGAIGISGMMHGYLPFDRDWRQLAEFRTWRNSITGQAAEILTEKFGFNVPQRWSIAHLYQAILNGEEHVKDVAHLTTLAGYLHYLLTGKNAIGIGEASGMFPIDSTKLGYDEEMLRKFDGISGLGVSISDILPEVLTAGMNAGYLSADGARLLDPSGTLRPGIPFAPCEGDAGTGMVATNSVRVHTGNVSAGTSIFSMLVADHALSVHKEIDMVTTPSGAPVAMVHCSNCTSDINAWVALFGELLGAFGVSPDKGELFTVLFKKALEGAPDCGGLLSYNYYSGESITGVDEGRPVFVRAPGAELTLANFMRTQLMSALATLRIGTDILRDENIRIDRLYGHGGFFKTPGVGQRLLSASVAAPVSVMETAGEGGPYGMAILAAYMLNKGENETLEDYLDGRVFADARSSTVMAEPEEIAGFNAFLEKYTGSFAVEKAAIETLY